jgi:hypothetical protein
MTVNLRLYFLPTGFQGFQGFRLRAKRYGGAAGALAKAGRRFWVLGSEVRMRSGRLVQVVAFVGIAGLGGWAGRTAHAQASAPPETLPSLLAEVRQLRVAIEQMASAGPRIQLVLGRLQLQEQRINNLLRRLETVRAELEGIQGEHDNLQLQLQGLEREAGETTDAERRRAFEAEVRAIKSRLPAVGARLQQRQTEESTLSADISAEQGRWTDFNQRLEELERALTRK